MKNGATDGSGCGGDDGGAGVGGNYGDGGGGITVHDKKAVFIWKVLALKVKLIKN